jgi:cysteine desulfurase / selenocysteine lyase
MTTPTPTSELGPALSLPDERALSALASALFQTPPSADSARPAPVSLPRLPVSIAAAPPPGLPTQPQFNFVPVATSLPATPPFTVSQPAAASHAAPSSVITPRLVPTPAQSADLPAASSTLQPLLGAASGPTAGVPEAYGALTPATPPTPTLLDSALPASPAGQPPSTPYYFLAEANAARGLPGATAVPLPGSFALPGGGDQLTAHAPAPPAPPNAPQSHAAPQFYFTDLALPRENDAKVGKPGPAAPFDVQAVRLDFPILQERVNGRPLIWFDNAATTQKPQAVIDRVSYFYAHENSNIHRAAHALAARATDAYEGARRTVARFIGAASVEEVIFVRGATEGINLVAKSWGAKNIGAGDEIVVTHLEHHANIVPWQQLASENGAVLKVIPVDDRGQVILAEAQKLIGPRTKIVAITQVSNALGTVVPVAALIEMAHRAGAKALVDGAQSVSHLRVDVRALDADFFVFSGHKIFGPTGIGVVYGKRALLEAMPPWQGGGNMIEDVTFEHTRYHGAPARFEAGTGNIADAVGLGAALEYVERIGIERIAAYEHELLDYATARLRPIAGVRLVGTADDKASVLSFVLKNYSTEEVGRALNEEGIAVRSGHHCAQPILRRFGLEATVRPSFAFYNTHEEVDVFIRVIQRLSEARR